LEGRIRRRYFWKEKIRRRLGEEEDGLTRGALLSATPQRRKALPLASWASGRVRPKAGNDARAGVTGRGEEVGYRPESEKKGNFLFLFSFSNITKHFQNNFESKFEFESNHSLQKFKCNNMSAQTCFYPYI
jgi:hypothetical protein